MKLSKNISIYLTVLISVYFNIQLLACENNLSVLVKNSDQYEKVGDFGYFFKNGVNWFHITQDQECWISIKRITTNNSKTLLKP